VTVVEFKSVFCKNSLDFFHSSHRISCYLVRQLGSEPPKFFHISNECFSFNSNEIENFVNKSCFHHLEFYYKNHFLVDSVEVRTLCKVGFEI